MARRPDLFAQIAALRASGTPAALATVISTRGSAPARDAMKMLVLADGTTRGTVGGGSLEEGIRRLALESIATEECRRGTFELSEEAADDTEMVCGGAVEVFVESVTIPTCFLLGAGHLAHETAAAAAVAGFRVVVADDRASHANAERFPAAHEVIARPWKEIHADLAPRLGPASYCVVVTRSHRLDEDCAEACLRSKARYVGMIGSSNKVRRCREALLARGLPEKTTSRLRAPIGLDLGARTHGEIAIAIVAEMVAVRRGGSAAESSAKKAAAPKAATRAKR